MAENSKIQWATHTFNTWRGCTKVSSGCANCYAETGGKRNPGVLGVWGPNGTRVVASEAMWAEPVKWDKAAEYRSKYDNPGPPPERPRVFCASLADVFEDWKGPMVDSAGSTLYQDGVSDWHTEGPPSHRLTMADVRQRLFDLIDRTPNLDWLLLTKRPESLQQMWIDRVGMESRPAGVRANVWLGTSVEDQKAAGERIPRLLAAPAAVRFLSMEPLLGPADLSGWLTAHCGCGHGPLANDAVCPDCGERQGTAAGIHWVIVRPFELDWARSIQAQCVEARVPLFFKQAGSNPRDWDRGDALNHVPPQLVSLTLKDKKGGDLSELPPSLHVREFPRPEAAPCA